jgi:hypothetical protein
MMASEHTPGPWLAIKGIEDGDELRCGVSAMRGDMGYMVATIENGAPGDFCDTEFANARLIAAAPDLLEALIACRDQFDFYAREHHLAGKHHKAETNERFAFIATQAILKAKGATDGA